MAVHLTGRVLVECSPIALDQVPQRLMLAVLCISSHSAERPSALDMQVVGVHQLSSCEVVSPGPTGTPPQQLQEDWHGRLPDP